jgi:hypothetical protein
MRTALAADEPEPERRRYLTSIATGLTAVAAGGGAVSSTIYTYPTAAGRPPVTTATFPQQVIGPWQCPECKVWNAPHVREHRCSE